VLHKLHPDNYKEHPEELKKNNEQLVVSRAAAWVHCGACDREK